MKNLTFIYVLVSFACFSLSAFIDKFILAQKIFLAVGGIIYLVLGILNEYAVQEEFEEEVEGEQDENNKI